MIYFTADTHFGEIRALQLSRRPFKDVNTMDEYMIHQWNTIVNPDDIVFHLGDFGAPKIAKKLNGTIILIPGNYDRNNLGPFAKNGMIIPGSEIWSSIEDCNDKTKIAGITISYIELRDCRIQVNLTVSAAQKEESPDQWSTEIATLALTHEPRISFSELLGNPKRPMNLFGHIHGRQKIKRYGMDVGVDANFFAPVSIETVLFYRNALINGYYDKYVFE